MLALRVVSLAHEKCHMWISHGAYKWAMSHINHVTCECHMCLLLLAFTKSVFARRSIKEKGGEKLFTGNTNGVHVLACASMCVRVWVCACVHVRMRMCAYMHMCLNVLIMCMYVCLFVCCMHTCLYEEKHVYYVCVFKCLYVSHVCVFLCRFVCMFLYAYVCLFACMHACMYVCIYGNSSVDAFPQLCMFLCMYVCMYVCMYTWQQLSSNVDVSAATHHRGAAKHFSKNASNFNKQKRVNGVCALLYMLAMLIQLAPAHMTACIQNVYEYAQICTQMCAHAYIRHQIHMETYICSHKRMYTHVPVHNIACGSSSSYLALSQRTPAGDVYMYILYIYINIWMYTYIYIYTCEYIYRYICIYIYIYVYTHISYIYICVCVCVYVQIFTCIRIAPPDV